MKTSWVLVTLVACSWPAALPGGDAKKDLDKLQGVWEMAALEVDGKSVPEDKLRGTTLTIKGDKYIVAVKDNKHEVTLTLDPTKTPRHIDMAFPDGGGTKVGKGIYKIEGDTFILCRSQSAENARPTEFGTWPNTGYFMVTWKRKAP